MRRFGNILASPLSWAVSGANRCVASVAPNREAFVLPKRKSRRVSSTQIHPVHPHQTSAGIVGAGGDSLPLVIPPTMSVGGGDGGERPQKRESRRRFSKSLTQGRSTFITELMDRMRSRSKQRGGVDGSSSNDRGVAYDRLPPRVKLDIARRLWHRDRALRMAQKTQHLPKYFSPRFNKKYFFQEEDLDEEFTRGRGPGGQATNRRMQTVILKHRPTGIVVKHSRWPSLWLNRRAARELMHLRLELRLMGGQSTLGLQQRSRKQKQKSSKRRRDRLLQSGNHAILLEMRCPNFFDFLRGSCGLPKFLSCPSLSHETSTLGDTSSPSKGDGTGGIPREPLHVMTITCLFNDKCHQWWQICDGMHRQVPERFQCFLGLLFPVVPCASHYDSLMSGCSEDRMVFGAVDERSAYEYLKRCRSDECVKERVRRAAACYFEMFGLSFLQKTSTTKTTWQLSVDEPNWFQLQDRWLVRGEGGGSSLTPLVRRSLPHLHTSLMQLEMSEEAAAIRKFLLRESKRAQEGNPANWAAESIGLIQTEVRELGLLASKASQTM